MTYRGPVPRQFPGCTRPNVQLSTRKKREKNIVSKKRLKESIAQPLIKNQRKEQSNLSRRSRLQTPSFIAYMQFLTFPTPIGPNEQTSETGRILTAGNILD
jgi:hypothetical protein